MTKMSAMVATLLLIGIANAQTPPFHPSGAGQATDSNQTMSSNSGVVVGSSNSGLISTAKVCVETAVGDKAVELRCPDAKIIKRVDAAAYGHMPGTCRSGATPNTSCTIDVTANVDKSCIMSNVCPVTLSEYVLGSPTGYGARCDRNIEVTFTAVFTCETATAEPMHAAATNTTATAQANNDSETPATASGATSVGVTVVTTLATIVAALI
ncbi:SUEL-type lectin domain-containing protein [Plasmodiophora brassicae]